MLIERSPIPKRMFAVEAPKILWFLRVHVAQKVYAHVYKPQNVGSYVELFSMAWRRSKIRRKFYVSTSSTDTTDSLPRPEQS